LICFALCFLWNALAADKKCQVAQSYLAKEINRSLEVWLALWPEHVVPINIWECCL
jgi:hypothetical protein